LIPSTGLGLGGQNVLTYYTGGNDTDAVLVSGPEVAPIQKQIVLQWKTLNELQMAGFNIYRAASPTFALADKINDIMLPAQYAGSLQEVVINSPILLPRQG